MVNKHHAEPRAHGFIIDFKGECALVKYPSVIYKDANNDDWPFRVYYPKEHLLKIKNGIERAKKILHESEAQYEGE